MPNVNQKNKKYLIDNNIKQEKCESCDLAEWLGNKIPLEVHHIDGNSNNNAYTNLQLLCPNCHSFTKNYRGRGKGRNNKPPVTEQEIINIIPQCQSIREVLLTLKLSGEGANYQRIRKIIEKTGAKLKKREMTEKEIDFRLKSRKIIRPSPEELKKRLWEKPAIHVATDLGVSDSAIQKWCNFYNIEKPPVGYWQKLNAKKNGIRGEDRTLT